MATSYFIPYFVVFGGLLGVVTCMVTALVAKPVNLGLGGNTLVGFCVGAAAGVTWLYVFDSYFSILLIGGPLACILVQTAIGQYLNARAR